MSGDLVQTNESSYGYTPSLVMGLVFVVIFYTSAILHLFQTFTGTSLSWMLLMAFGCALEVGGWGSRLWSRFVPAADGYIAQMCCLVIAPTFYSAALYMLLGLLISIVAPRSSPLSPKNFKIFFMVADVSSLFLQAAGGGIAATANTQSGKDLGSNLMLTGIVIQLIVMVVFVLYAVVWCRRAAFEWQEASKGLHFMLVGIAISSFGIIVRGFYRTAELAQGFNGALAEDQMSFLLDAVPTSIATIAINVFHPSRLLPLRSNSYVQEIDDSIPLVKPQAIENSGQRYT